MRFKIKESNLKLKNRAKPFFLWNHCGVLQNISCFFLLFGVFCCFGFLVFTLVSVALILWTFGRNACTEELWIF